jgi:hypothetical protein
MWPFDDPRNQIPAPRSARQLGPDPVGDPRDLKIQELRERLLGLECAIIEICTIMKSNQEINNANFKAMEQGFLSLIQYVMTPRASILGERKDKN